MSTKVRISENNTKQKVIFFVLYCRAEECEATLFENLRDAVSKVHIFIVICPIFSKNSVRCNFYMNFNIS